MKFLLRVIRDKQYVYCMSICLLASTGADAQALVFQYISTTRTCRPFMANPEALAAGHIALPVAGRDLRTQQNTSTTQYTETINDVRPDVLILASWRAICVQL